VIDNVSREVSGNWRIIRGNKETPDAIIYQLDFGIAAKPISLLAGDENVLFFLNPENELYTGSSDFSFTLNRRQ